MARPLTNYSEIQHDEIEALRSIYPDDFFEEEAKIGAWNKTLDRAFRIALKTNSGTEAKTASITLFVSLPPTYPKSLPNLGLDFDESVRAKVRAAAEDIIRLKPKSLIGSEMIYDLTIALQELLDSIPQHDPKNLPTLDEERTAGEQAAKVKAREAEAAQQLEAAKTATENATDQEHELLQELVKQEKARAARRKAHYGADGEWPLPERIPRGLSFDRPSAASIRDPNGEIITVRAVSQKLLYKQGPVATLSLVSPWPESQNANCGAFLILKECHCRGVEPTIKQRLQDLESSLETQMRAMSHQSVVRPMNFRMQRTNGEEKESAGSVCWTASILSEFTSKGSLHDFLTIASNLEVNKFRAWSMQLLEGLHYYHQQGLAHGSVHLANALLWESEALTTIAKWSDGVYGNVLHQLTSHFQPRNHFNWVAPEILAGADDLGPTICTDIWNFGVCLLEMAFGLNVLRQYEGPLMAISQLGLAQSLKSLLSAVFNSNAKKRPSAWDLLHFEFFRNEDGYFVERSGSKSMISSRIRRESQAPSDSSEYSRKFVEEGRLGRGGFGEVFRARNKTDGQLYAIKKIKAGSRAALDPVLSEATVLSRLNHPNVVRYFSSWIEEDALGGSQIISENELSQERDTTSTESLGLQSAIPPSFRGLDFISFNNTVFEDSADSSDISSECESESSESDKYPKDDLPSAHEPHTYGSSRETGQIYYGRGADISKNEASTVLYIQMEYCKQETLRDLINTGICSKVTETWRLLRQIVQGLAHIHSALIVHRDLKPENIFIDSSGDLRIGDFGLARPGEHRMPKLVQSSAKYHLGSFTKDVGTAWYVAPEVRSSSGGRYDEKADIYSLGIIFVEMNVSFTTGMERAQTLDSLAKEDHKLPSAMTSPEKSTQASILKSLIEYYPAKRPSCSELLDEIPIPDEGQTSRLIRRELNNPDSRLRSDFISSLFSAPSKEDGLLVAPVPSNPVQKVRLLEGVASMARNLPDLELQTNVKRQLAKIFRWHGAVERTDNPAVFPHHPSYATSDVIRMLDTSGNSLQLPYDLILPNAILLARSTRNESKTFAFGDVYRPDPRRADPNIFGEADFDIVHSSSNNLALDEAEVLKVVDEILDIFPNLSKTTMCYHINHSIILDRILAFCSIDQGNWFAIKETMSKLNTAEWTWARVRHELRAPPISMASTSLDELESFDFRDPVDKAVPKLRLMLQDTTELESTFAHLKTVTTYLARMNVRRKVYLSPLSSYNEKFYQGNFFFQCLYDRKTRSVFAAGGRYDALIRNHQPLPSKELSVRGVGFQMTWSGLCTGMMNFLNAQAKVKAKRRPQIDKVAWSTRRCDVLVDCYDPYLLDKIGIRVLSDLWASHISAELASVDVGSNIYTKSMPTREDYSWVIRVKSPDMVKVKSSIRTDEADIRMSELIHYLKGEMRERDRTEGRHPIATLPRNDSQLDGPSHDREMDVKVLMSQTKGKKTNRKTIIEEAVAQAQEWRASALDYPVVAIETKDEVFQAIENTRLEDAESWKRMIQSAPAGERQYLGQIQTLLKEQKGTNAAFIYNFRTKAILYYPLGKKKT